MSWQGNILRIDLSKSKVTKEPLNIEWAEQYLGTRGLGVRYLMDAMDPKTPALDPGNALIFATGPLTGTMASTSGRYSVVTKSPLTNCIACSNSGGKFGAELKYAGYDLLIITGKSDRPVYLQIIDGQVEICDASAVWGKTVWEADSWIHKSMQDPQVKVAAIGKSGEDGVLYSCIVNDLHRAAGRSGVGAVMGSKLLKAIAIRGTKGLKNNNSNFMNIVEEVNAELHASKSRQGLMRYGTLAMMHTMQEFGGLPTNNFQEVSFEKSVNINHRAVTKQNKNNHTNLITNAACFGCTIACGRIAKVDPKHFSVKDRPEYWDASGGLEYETAFAFGPALGIDDLDAMTFAGFMMNEHGMDPISFGVTLAAAMELNAMGVLTKEMTDNVDLKFGNAEALVIMSEKTGKCEGFGKELGLGSKKLCEKYGHPEIAMVSKGQEFAGYDGRAMQGMGLGYATSNRGACHMKHDTFKEDFKDPGTVGKAKACIHSQNFVAMVDSSGLCIFTTGVWGYEHFAKMIQGSCGGQWDESRLRQIGERVWNIERVFNLRAGLSKSDDSLPPRMLRDKLKTGFAKGGVVDLEKMLPEYYALRGWDNEGVPQEHKITELDLTVL